VLRDFAARLAQILANPIPAILGYRDSLQLTADQVARLQAISDSLDAATRDVSDSLTAESRRAGEHTDPTALYDRLRLKLAEGRRQIRHALEAAQRVLTPHQWARLPDAVKTPAPR
jgi:signal transduction histidine kinase